MGKGGSMTKTERELLIAQRELIALLKSLIDPDEIETTDSEALKLNKLSSKVAKLEAKIIEEENQ